MATMDADKFDSIVTDPPYGLGFMGKEWDHDVPGGEFWVQALRVAKPGAHMLAFGGTRKFHRMACAIEDAGWEIRDTIMWVYGSGFPKSLDVSKAIDKAAGAERTEITGTRHRNVKPYDDGNGWNHNNTTGDHAYTAPATDAARQWSGWGTALKPAWEPIILARKPLAGTVAANCLEHGTGALNIEGCRVGTEALEYRTTSYREAATGEFSGQAQTNHTTGSKSVQGRWPANLIHDGSEEVLSCFPDAKGQQGEVGPQHGAKESVNAHGDFGPRNKAIPRSDAGSAARFFYCAKASREDRNEGCEEISAKPLHWSSGSQNPGSFQREGTDKTSKNNHPTVKPTDLMRYLCRMVTPKGGVILDPFAGSGSTGKAAVLEGFQFIGIELNPEYAEIAQLRLKHAKDSLGLGYFFDNSC
jgi:site-specific DNA-methyltransferase (adenine-specific)